MVKPHLKQKDQKFRKKYNLLEKKYILLKAIQSNQFVSFNVRIKINLNLNKLTNSSKTKIINRCLNTNNSRSLYRPFNLSRHEFKRLACNGELIGVKKSSW